MIKILPSNRDNTQILYYKETVSSIFVDESVLISLDINACECEYS